MKPPSPALLALIDELVDRQGGRLRAVDESRALNVLRSLEELGDPRGIPFLLPLLVAEGGAGGKHLWIRSLWRRRAGSTAGDRVASAAGSVLATLLARTRLGDLPALERHVRAQLAPAFDLRWSELRSLSELRFPAEHLRTVAALLSWHRNGYLRESAVRELARIEADDELPFLILRLSDWVAPVRDAARAAAVAHVRPERVRSLVRHQPLFTRLEGLTRVDNMEIVERVRTLLRAPASLAALIDGLEHPDPDVRINALERLLEHGSAPWAEILERVSRDENVQLRRSALGPLWRRSPNDRRNAILERLVRDPHPGVRQSALRLFVEERADEAPPRLRVALLDRSATGRLIARFHLERLTGQTDFAPGYRAALAEAPACGLPVALCGLAETGSAEDVALIRPFLRHDRSSIVRAALRALHRLDPDGTRDALRTFLWDPRPGVTHCAARHLRAGLGASDLSVLASALRAGALHTQRAVVRLARTLQPWEALPVLATLPLDAGSDVRADVIDALDATVHAYRHALYAPRPATPEELTALEENLPLLAAVLPTELAKDLRDIADEARQVG